MSEFEQPDYDLKDDDVEMAAIAEEEDLDEKFSHQGTSTVGGKKKIVRNYCETFVLNLKFFSSLHRLCKTSSS